MVASKSGRFSLKFACLFYCYIRRKNNSKYYAHIRTKKYVSVIKEVWSNFFDIKCVITLFAFEALHFYVKIHAIFTSQAVAFVDGSAQFIDKAICGNCTCVHNTRNWGWMLNTKLCKMHFCCYFEELKSNPAGYLHRPQKVRINGSCEM